MRKLFTLLILMCCAIGMNATVEISGKELTSGNTFTSSSGVGITSGKISLSGSTLTLDNVTMSTAKNYCITNSTSGLKIVLKGTSKLTATDAPVTNFLANTTITSSDGTGTMYATAATSNWDAIRLTSNTLTIEDCNLYANSPYSGIMGWVSSGSSATCSLVINNAYVEATGGTAASIKGFKSLTLTGSEITTPTGAAFNSSQAAVCTSATSSTPVKTTVKIAPIKYPIYVKGEQVTYKNKDNILGDGKVRMYVAGSYYNLFFTNATINAGSSKAVYVTDKCDRKVYLSFAGTNNFTSSSDAIYIANEGNVIFDKSGDGDAIANITSTGTGDTDAIFLGSSTTGFTISKNVTINAKTSGAYGIRNYNTGSFYIDNATVTAKGGSYSGHNGGIYSAVKPTLTGVFVFDPIWGEYNSKKQGYTTYNDRNSSTASLASTVKIIPGEDYGVRICGIGVNSTNYSNINSTLKSAGYLTAGSASYEPNGSIGKYILFNGATIKTAQNIVWAKDNVTVILQGDNNFTVTSGAYGFHSEGGMELRYYNDSSNKSTATVSCGAGIAFSSSTYLRFFKTEVTATSSHSYAANCGTDFTATDSKVFLTSAKSAIAGAKTLDLNGSYTRAGSYNTSTKLFEDAKGNAAKSAEIYRGYGLIIGGTEVTKSNYSSYNYDPSTQTFTPTNSRIGAATSTNNIILSYTPLTILVGDGLDITYSTAASTNPIKNHAPLTIKCEGTGKLNLKASASGKAAINVFGSNSTITFDNANVTMNAAYGISGNNNPVVINGGVIDITSTDEAIYSISSLELKNTAIATPAGAKFDASKQAVVTSDGTKVTGHLVIKNVTYGLEIAGTKVTTVNKDNIPVSSGSAKFDPETGTLTLTNATISPSGSSQGIMSEIPLTINLVGTSKIKTTGNYGIECSKDLTIQSASDGKLTVNTNSYGIAGRANTTIKNCGVSITADGTNSIGLYGYNTGKVTIDNANVDINANGGAIKQVASLTTNKTGIVTPTKGKYSSSSKSVVDANGNVATTVKIETEVYYNFSLNGIRVSNLTAADIEGDGSAVYDRATRTLTLDDFVINDCDITGICIEEDMNIVIKGKSSVNIIEAGNALYIENCKVTISGGAELYLGSDDDAAIELSNATLTLNSANVRATSKTTYAIKDKSLNSSLIVNSSKVTLNSKTAAAYIKSATLNDCFVDTPDNGYFAAAKNMFTDENGNVAEDVTILAGEATDKTAPVLPSDATITVTNITDTSAAITWTTATDNKSTVFAITYEVNFRKSSESTYTVAGTIKGGCQYSLAGLEEDTEYIVTVYAIDEAGNRSEGYDFAKFKTEKAPDTTAPTLPTDATINVTETTPSSITISWEAPTDNITPADKLNYQIVYGVHGSETGITKYATGVTSFTIDGLDENTTYDIGLDVWDEAGNTVTYGDITASTTIAPDVTKPFLPTDASITATEVTKNSIAISWNAASDDKTPSANLKYEILINKDGSWSTVAYLAGATEYTIKELDPETEYKVTVYVSDAAGNESAYEALTVTTLAAPDETKPTLPADATITAKEITKTSITITWNAASDDKTDAADLNYEVLIQKDGAWTTLANLTGVTEYTIEGLEDMTEYKIAVYVSDDSGNQAAYETLTASTAVGIDAILAENPDVKMYNTAGVLVGKNYRGVVVINGKKYMKTK